MVIRKDKDTSVSTCPGQIWLFRFHDNPGYKDESHGVKEVFVRSILLDFGGYLSPEQEMVLKQAGADFDIHKISISTPVYEIYFPFDTWRALILRDLERKDPICVEGVELTAASGSKLYFRIFAGKTLKVKWTDRKNGKGMPYTAYNQEPYGEFYSALRKGGTKHGKASGGSPNGIPEARKETELNWVAKFNEAKNKWSVKYHFSSTGWNFVERFGAKVKDPETIMKLTGCLKDDLKDYDFD